MMQAAALLEAQKEPDPEKVIADMDDVICRCGTYQAIRRGVRTAAKMMKEERRGS
jgi:aerobic-type carbon monoxide dehydrogenase small subunit (CoxS/CutS family)